MRRELRERYQRLNNQCPVWVVDFHKELVDKVQREFGIVPEMGGMVSQDLICTDETVARSVIDLVGGSIAVEQNVDILDFEGEVKVDPPDRKYVKKEVEEIEIPGYYAPHSVCHPCKVVEEHEHEGIWHEHFMCSSVPRGLRERKNVIQPIVRQLTKIIQDYGVS